MCHSLAQKKSESVEFASKLPKNRGELKKEKLYFNFLLVSVGVFKKNIDGL